MLRLKTKNFLMYSAICLAAILLSMSLPFVKNDFQLIEDLESSLLDRNGLIMGFERLNVFLFPIASIVVSMGIYYFTKSKNFAYAALFLAVIPILFVAGIGYLTQSAAGESHLKMGFFLLIGACIAYAVLAFLKFHTTSKEVNRRL